MTVAPTSTLRVTTLPAPTTASSPMVMPGRMIEPPPSHTLRPIATGRVIGRVDLDTRTNLRSRADIDSSNVENHAIEVEKYIFAKIDIVAIVTIEGRPDHGSLADGR